MSLCPQCGAPAKENATKCEYCGAALFQPAPQPVQQPIQQPQQVVYVQNGVPNERANWPIKSKIVAGILALFLGGLGVHKFYLGQGGMGVVYLLFCWTCIPAFVAFIEAIILFCSSDDAFETKYRCRVG